MHCQFYLEYNKTHISIPAADLCPSNLLAGDQTTLQLDITHTRCIYLVRIINFGILYKTAITYWRMMRLYSISLPIWGRGPTAPTGGWECIPREEEQEAPIPDDDIPVVTFSSLLTVGVDSKDEEREVPRSDEVRCVIDGDELLGCR